jgi:hypothetical protein
LSFWDQLKKGIDDLAGKDVEKWFTNNWEEILETGLNMTTGGVGLGTIVKGVIEGAQTGDFDFKDFAKQWGKQFITGGTHLYDLGKLKGTGEDLARRGANIQAKEDLDAALRKKYDELHDSVQIPADMSFETFRELVQAKVEEAKKEEEALKKAAEREKRIAYAEMAPDVLDMDQINASEFKLPKYV